MKQRKWQPPTGDVQERLRQVDDTVQARVRQHGGRSAHANRWGVRGLRAALSADAEGNWHLFRPIAEGEMSEAPVVRFRRERTARTAASFGEEDLKLAEQLAGRLRPSGRFRRRRRSRG